MRDTFKSGPDTTFNHDEFEIDRSSLKMKKLWKEWMSFSKTQPCSCWILIRAGRCYALIGLFMLEGRTLQRVNCRQLRRKSCSSCFSNNCIHGKATRKELRLTYQDDHLKERATTTKIKLKPGERGGATEQRQGGKMGSRVASSGVSCYS